jgi:hypothetical protein
MAGSIGLSLTQRYDKTSHEPLDGGMLYFFAAGTTTPQNAFQDISLTIPWGNPLTLDSGGNVPQLFFDDGYIKFRLTNSAGVAQIEADYVLVLGPTAGAGAAPSVDATTIFSAGDLKPRYGTGAHDGWVRANGRTIGNASSGATERANADTSALFVVLYDDVNLSVSGGRGASAAADYAAGKTIALPDWRGRNIAGLDDMGNTAAGRLTATYFGTAATALGAASTPTESKTILTANLPAYTPSGTIVTTSTVSDIARGSLSTRPNTGGPLTTIDATAVQAITSTSTFTGTAQGGVSTPFSIVQPTMLTTIYIKL